MKQVNTTRIGRKWEIYAHQNLFPGSVLVTNIDRNAHFDLKHGEATINVKAGKLVSKKHGKYFNFLFRTGRGCCDYFCLVGYRKQRDKKPVKVWLIPSDLVAGRNYLTIGPNHAGTWKEFEMSDRGENIENGSDN